MTLVLVLTLAYVGLIASLIVCLVSKNEWLNMVSLGFSLGL